MSEALTNAAKHADASSVTVAGRLDATAGFAIEVADDGAAAQTAAGGAACRDWSTGSPTLDGRLAVDSPPGGGTRLVAEIPCG